LSDENYQAGVYGINTFKLALVVAASLYAQQYQVEVASYATNLIEEKIGEITKAVEEQARSIPTTLLNAPFLRHLSSSIAHANHQTLCLHRSSLVPPI
jgi:hypothetical protein